jgi:hypothetical protein
MTVEPTETAEKSIWMPYSWSTGPGIGAFLTGLREGEVLAAVCPDCDDHIVPARSFCPDCQVEIDDFVPVEDAGHVETATVVRADRETAPFDPPYALALIALDGADTSMVHVVRGDEEALVGLEPGARVEAVWAPAEEREGSVLDIEGFVPEGRA